MKQLGGIYLLHYIILIRVNVSINKRVVIVLILFTLSALYTT